jgi:hypothetical protein
MAEEYEGCKYHSSGWWEKHPRADHPETQNTIPIFDIIFWQTEDATGLYRTFTYCPCLCEDEETQEQFNQLAIYLTDALIGSNYYAYHNSRWYLWGNKRLCYQ